MKTNTQYDVIDEPIAVDGRDDEQLAAERDEALYLSVLRETEGSMK